MKVTKEYIKKLILEEIQEQAAAEQSAPPSEENLQDIKAKLLDVAKNLSGIQRNEIEMVNLFIQMIELAKTKNINVGEFKRKLGLAKDAAEKITT